MEAMIAIFLLGVFIFFFIIYNLMKSAAKEGALEALAEYEKAKNKHNIIEE